MAMGKGIDGMAGGKTTGKMGANRDAVAARKAASVATGNTAPKTATSKAGFGVLGNAKAGAGAGLKARTKGVMAAYKTGGSKAAAQALRETAGRKKPSGMY